MSFLEALPVLAVAAPALVGGGAYLGHRLAPSKKVGQEAQVIPPKVGPDEVDGVKLNFLDRLRRDLHDELTEILENAGTVQERLRRLADLGEDLHLTRWQVAQLDLRHLRVFEQLPGIQDPRPKPGQSYLSPSFFSITFHDTIGGVRPMNSQKFYATAFRILAGLLDEVEQLTQQRGSKPPQYALEDSAKFAAQFALELRAAIPAFPGWSPPSHRMSNETERWRSGKDLGLLIRDIETFLVKTVTSVKPSVKSVKPLGAAKAPHRELTPKVSEPAPKGLSREALGELDIKILPSNLQSTVSKLFEPELEPGWDRDRLHAAERAFVQLHQITQAQQHLQAFAGETRAQAEELVMKNQAFIKESLESLYEELQSDAAVDVLRTLRKQHAYLSGDTSSS